MNVWLVFPSCNVKRARTALEAWRARGYYVAVHLDPGLLQGETIGADVQHVAPFQGYWSSVNALAQSVADKATMIVAAADDMEPDPVQHPNAIAEAFYQRFPDGYGVMQPTGDDLAGTDKICGSPWFGMRWVAEAYCGRGPCPLKYRHFFGDEELLHVARGQGVLWQRPDLTQRHNHWMRPGGPPRTDYQIKSSAWWDADQQLFNERRAAGFPGSARAFKM
jgi:hypothetical protein